MNNDKPIQDWELGDGPTPEQARIERGEALADDFEPDESPAMSDAALVDFQQAHAKHLAERAKQVDAQLQYLMRAYPFPGKLVEDCRAAMGVNNETAR